MDGRRDISALYDAYRFAVRGTLRGRSVASTRAPSPVLPPPSLLLLLDSSVVELQGGPVTADPRGVLPAVLVNVSLPTSFDGDAFEVAQRVAEAFDTRPVAVEVKVRDGVVVREVFR